MNNIIDKRLIIKTLIEKTRNYCNMIVYKVK